MVAVPSPSAVTTPVFMLTVATSLLSLTYLIISVEFDGVRTTEISAVLPMSVRYISLSDGVTLVARRQTLMVFVAIVFPVD